MKKTEKTEQKSKPKKPQFPENRRTRRRSMRFFLAMLAIYLMFLIGRPFLDAGAITLPEPIGTIYFDKTPSERLVAHESYHLHKQIEELGALRFYLSYIFGQGCILEAEAGWHPEDHTVCDIPWMQQPTDDQIAQQYQIMDWYKEHIRNLRSGSAKR